MVCGWISNHCFWTSSSVVRSVDIRASSRHGGRPRLQTEILLQANDQWNSCVVNPYLKKTHPVISVDQAKRPWNLLKLTIEINPASASCLHQSIGRIFKFVLSSTKSKEKVEKLDLEML